MTTRRSVMARKSVTVRLTPRQAIAASAALSREASMHDGETASRLFSASIAVNSALYEDGWEFTEFGQWEKEIDLEQERRRQDVFDIDHMSMTDD